jgi:hypothetical protein
MTAYPVAVENACGDPAGIVGESTNEFVALIVAGLLMVSVETPIPVIIVPVDIPVPVIV